MQLSREITRSRPRIVRSVLIGAAIAVAVATTLHVVRQRAFDRAVATTAPTIEVKSVRQAEQRSEPR